MLRTSRSGLLLLIPARGNSAVRRRDSSQGEVGCGSWLFSNSGRGVKLSETTKIHPVTLFVLLSLTFGSAIAFVVPPLRGPDEIAHFLRIHSYARGKLDFSSFEQARLACRVVQMLFTPFRSGATHVVQLGAIWIKERGREPMPPSCCRS
jgi:hypothetical protein